MTEQLKLLMDYTIFHIGLYATLCTLLIAILGVGPWKEHSAQMPHYLLRACLKSPHPSPTAAFRIRQPPFNPRTGDDPICPIAAVRLRLKHWRDWGASAVAFATLQAINRLSRRVVCYRKGSVLADFPATSRANRAAPGSGAGDVTEARAAFESQAIEKAQRRADVTALRILMEKNKDAQVGPATGRFVIARSPPVLLQGSDLRRLFYHLICHVWLIEPLQGQITNCVPLAMLPASRHIPLLGLMNSPP